MLVPTKALTVTAASSRAALPGAGKQRADVSDCQPAEAQAEAPRRSDAVGSKAAKPTPPSVTLAPAEVAALGWRAKLTAGAARKADGCRDARMQIHATDVERMIACRRK